MKKITYNEKVNAILSYLFMVGLISGLKKDKSSFLKKHVRRGRALNIIVLIWLLSAIISYRILTVMDFLSVGTLNIIKLVLYIINIVICILILAYQLIWISKIIKKKDC